MRFLRGNRNLRLLWTAGAISSLGSWLLVVAVPLQIYRLTGSAVATGFALVAEALPAVLIGPWAGVLVDRRSRRHVIVAAYATCAISDVIMLVGAGTGRYALLYAGLLAETLAAIFLGPALRAATPAIAGNEADLASANALTSAANAVFRMIGPPLGALLVTRGWFAAVALIDLASFLLAAGLVARLALPVPGPADGPVRLRDGIRYILGTPMLRGLLTTSWLFLAANAALTALLVPFVAARLGRPAAVGVLVSGLGAGYLAGSALSRMLLDQGSTRTVLACAYAAVGGCFLVLFNASTLPVALAAISLAGVPGAVLLVVTGHRMQTSTPDESLGRVASAFVASDATATLAGAVLGPVLLAIADLPVAVNAFSAAVLLAAIAAAALIPVQGA